MTERFPVAEPMWCAGCGHHAVREALLATFEEAGVLPHDVVVLAGIGCSGTIQNTLGAYGYHALHGRVLPTAIGVALANPALTVIAAGGDGDGYAIGAGHLVHAFRRNPSFVYLVMNNGTYGLTKGQPSPTTGLGMGGAAGREALDGVRLGLSVPGATFVARGYARWWDQLGRLLRAALAHAAARRGFAFVEVVSPCVVYRDTYATLEHHLRDVDAEPGYDPGDRAGAFARAVALEAAGELPVGLVFRDPAASAHAAGPAPATAGVEVADHHTAYAEILASFTI